MLAKLLVSVVLWLLANFGVQPDNDVLMSHVWRNDQPIKIDNVESYVHTVVSVPYSTFDPNDEYDTCGIWFTAIRFDDGVTTILLERDCQDVSHCYLSAYTMSVNGWRYTDF